MERVLFWEKHFEQIRGEPRRGRCAGFFKWTCVRGQRIAQHPVLVLQLRERVRCERNSGEGKSKRRTSSMYPRGVSFVSMQLLIKGGTTKGDE